MSRRLSPPVSRVKDRYMICAPKDVDEEPSATLARRDYDRTRAIMENRVRLTASVRRIQLSGRGDLLRQMRHREFDVPKCRFRRLISKFQDPRSRHPDLPYGRSGTPDLCQRGCRNPPADLVGKRIGSAEYQLTAKRLDPRNPERRVRRDALRRDLPGGREEADAWRRPRCRCLRTSRSNTSGPPGSRPPCSSPADDALFSLVRRRLLRTERTWRLFEDTHAAEREHYDRTGTFPIMHVVAIRRRFTSAPVGGPIAVQGFVEAQRMAYHLARDGSPQSDAALAHPACGRDRSRDGPISGLRLQPNVSAIHKLFRHHHEQACRAS